MYGGPCALGLPAPHGDDGPMKRRVLSGAAVLGLLLLGAATLQDTPGLRDVLRGRVGQPCEVLSRDGVWTLEFARIPGADEEGRETARRSADTAGRLELLGEALQNAGTEDERIRVEREAAMAEQFARLLAQTNRAVAAAQSVTLTAVGQDFVQLRYQDGTERFIPMQRVEVVVLAGR